MPKVLIAEDDFLIAEMLHEAVSHGGYEVCGIATDASEVVALGEQHRPDLAIIDVRLARGSDGLQAAAQLASQLEIGILYASGNCHRVLAMRPPIGEACLNKPFTMSDVVQALKVVEHIRLAGEAPPLLPGRLQLLREDHRRPSNRNPEA